MAKIVGKIEWFGGYNAQGKQNNYGFIKPHGSTQSVYVHRSNIQCPAETLKADVYVVFKKVVKQNKSYAIEVSLLEDETDKAILEYCIQDKDLRIPILKRYIDMLSTVQEIEVVLKQAFGDSPKAVQATLKQLPEPILKQSIILRSMLSPYNHLEILCSPDICILDTAFDELVITLKEFKTSKSPYTSFLATLLCPKLFAYYHRTDDEFFKALPAVYLDTMIDSLSKDDQNSKLSQQILRFISLNNLSIDWNDIPIQILKNKELYEIAPPTYKLEFQTSYHEYFDKESFKELLTSIDKEVQCQFILKVKELTIQDKELFSKLPFHIQADVYDFSLVPWDWMPNQSKALYLYKLAYTNTGLPLHIIQCENNIPIKTLAQMLLPENHPNRTTFTQLDKAINNAIIYNFEHKDSINLYPLLPLCPKKTTTYCESRAWYISEDKQRPHYTHYEAHIWCPRLGRTCAHIAEDGYFGDSHLYPRPQLPWMDWTLIEYMYQCNIVPVLPGLNNPNEYATKISGWANKLEDLLERAKCRLCNQTMKADVGYAKRFDARYNATIFHCRSNEFGHDQNIYFNHCWACSKVIDSRESSIRYQGMYLCIQCGSGPRNEQDPNFTPGQICPKCSISPMNPNYLMLYSQQQAISCTHCGHTIYPTKY